MNDPQVWSFISTVFIVLVACVLSSKKQKIARVRMYCFVGYAIGCAAFVVFGYLINDIWIIIQNVILFGLDIRGIRNSRREYKNGE